MAKVLALLLVGGCSIALQARPEGAAGCHTSHAYWIADAVMAAAGAAAIAYSVTNPDSGDAVMTAAGLGGLVAVIAGGSATDGFRWRSQCSK